MSQELQVIQPNNNLVQVVSNKGLDKLEEQTIQLSYQPYFDQMAQIKELAKKIDFDNPTEMDERIAKELRLKTVKIRTGSEEIKNERKRIHSLKANIEQDAWNLIKSSCQLEEELFLQVEKRRENAEKLRKENLRVERLSILSELCDNASIYPLGEMAENAFNDLVNGFKLAKEAKIEADRVAELQRIEAAKAEQERLEQQRLENERLRAEALKAKVEADRIALENKVKAEKLAKIEADKLAEANAKLKAEQDAKAKLEAELKAKKDAEVAAENKAKAEADRIAKAPVKEQMTAWIDTFVFGPHLSNDTTKNILSKFESFKTWAKTEIEKL
jgi:predicted ABC-type ATPase